MRNAYFILFFTLLMGACATKNYRSLENQSAKDMLRAKYECKYGLNEPRREFDNEPSQTQQSIPNDTQVNCRKIGDFVNCNTHSSPNAAYSAGAGIGNLIGSIIASVRENSRMDECMSSKGFSPE
jgi:hypothetical protein